MHCHTALFISYTHTWPSMHSKTDPGTCTHKWLHMHCHTDMFPYTDTHTRPSMHYKTIPSTHTTQSDTHAHTHQAIHALQDNPMHTFTHTQTLTHAHTRGYACTATPPYLHTHTPRHPHALKDNPIDTNNTLRHSPTHTGYPCTTPCTHTHWLSIHYPMHTHKHTQTHLEHTHNWLSNCSTTQTQLLKHE